MTPLDPADYELIRPARSGKPWPPVRCYYCGAPATYRETFASRDRESRCHTRGVCDDCYQAAAEGRHEGIIYKQRQRTYLIGKMYQETKKAPSGRSDREFGGQTICSPKTAETIAQDTL